MATLGIIAFILVALVVTGYTQIAALSAVVLIFLFVIIIRHSNKEDFENSKNAVSIAVKFIEEGYAIAAKYPHSLEGRTLTMYAQNDGPKDKGFLIVLYTHCGRDTLENLLEQINEEFSWWEIGVHSDDLFYIGAGISHGIECDWNKFNKAVWDEIKEKHPDWAVDFIYNEKSVVHL